MKIIIVGAGQVGGTLAEHLASEANDITVVDVDGNRLRELQDRLDIRTVEGMGCHPDVLMRASIEDADMLVAVTSSDEINMLACQVAYSLFRTPTKIARVRAQSYVLPRYRDKLFSADHLPVDVLITPEQVVTDYIHRLVEQPGSLQVLDFADGIMQLVAVRAYSDGPLVGNQLRSLREHMPNVDCRVAAIFRRDRSIVPEGDTVIEAGDEVFFIAAKKNIRAVMGELRQLENPYRRLIIAGGGNIGYRLAQALARDYNVKIIEFSKKRCEFLAEHLENITVLNGSATDQELLLEESIDKTDLFLALTNDDEVNIMASLLAKRLGARKVMTLIQNQVYANLMQGGEIDIAISPQQATTSLLLTHVRKSGAVNVHSLRRGAAEALEIIVHGDAKSSKVVGRRIEEIKSPPGATLAALERNGEVIIAHRDTVIESGDHVIVFVVDKKRVKDIEKLFQVGFTFF
ncbi:MAG: Trk system potassium transporter TrkA [Porticoccaceae bacterium]|jgi:trk system potassium uptake protein TrkA|nr:Trk system potassium transporter TrkA [Porticoccaceae bacterium]MEA3299168.1 Trk system potassium transporter TrkA [Pseudomonadota bacterium]HLS97649.1 Trk system potassium transporter TrkA [Porticoccaceae bacterium]